MPLSPQALKDAYIQSFDTPWPSNKNRKRCPNCEEWTLFKFKFIGYWICAHMEGSQRCGYSEEVQQ